MKRKRAKPTGRRAWMADLKLDDLVSYTDDDGAFMVGKIKTINIRDGYIRVWYREISKTTTLTHLNNVRPWLAPYAVASLSKVINIK